ncbi:hypothetical protein J31TS4_25860 [Paenibacillus sp. J31TS4]|uniref:acyl-CoA thioesterase n=1 Tax=Paenibacillus sp. J31TS4 TaxID=2807195 RepID=UPI001B26ED33|nr:thioesterase family protein [Paenibacillus sp. J31TS4]GIP39306.1 hypothetical protein J31TS4_25860 [Paenibacillus sp. J31TS4]
MTIPYIATKEIELTYADTDKMGVIYHGSYIRWLELGRTRLIEDVGFDYLEMERAGYFAPVYNLDITYKKSIRLGDRAAVRTWVEDNSGIRTTYGFQIVNGQDEVCAEGTTTHIVVKQADGDFRPVSFKKAFPDWFAKYEAIKRKVD